MRRFAPMANWKASSKLVFPALFVADKHSQIIQFDLDVRQGTKISDADRDYFDFRSTWGSCR